MVAIKNMEMPKGCWHSTNLKMSRVTTCPLKSYCSEKHIKEAPLDTRPTDCPLVEIITCKECKYYRPDDDTGYCTNHAQREIEFWCRDDYYCADGERKE